MKRRVFKGKQGREGDTLSRGLTVGPCNSNSPFTEERTEAQGHPGGPRLAKHGRWSF